MIIISLSMVTGPCMSVQVRRLTRAEQRNRIRTVTFAGAACVSWETSVGTTPGGGV